MRVDTDGEVQQEQTEKREKGKKMGGKKITSRSHLTLALSPGGGEGSACGFAIQGVTVAPVFGCYPHRAILSLRLTAPNCVMLRRAASFLG
jgi:hypothetical protein